MTFYIKLEVMIHIKSTQVNWLLYQANDAHIYTNDISFYIEIGTWTSLRVLDLS
jgi:hypothetical protein